MKKRKINETQTRNSNSENITEIGGNEMNFDNSFDTIIGYESVKQELLRVCDLLKNNAKYSALGVTMPSGLLLAGEPGLGKTTMAKCFINESGLRAFVCRKTKSNGQFVDIIKDAFDRAVAAAPAIVFLDDMDKFANNDEDHSDAEELVTVQSCIDEVRDKGVFVIATVNDTRKLPKSLLRAGRFDMRIEIEAPKGDEAKRIISYYLSKKQFVADVDVDIIGNILDGYSCADLETVVNEAGIYAGYAGKSKIDTDDIIRACMRIIFNAPASANAYSERALNMIASHEAGHAVVAEILEPGSVNIISASNYDSNTGGVTSVCTDLDYFHCVDYMENRITMLLAGKAATEMCFGTLDTGASADIKRAVDIARRFVTGYGQAGYFCTDRYTDDCAYQSAAIDASVNMLMSRLYERARRILAENREFLDALALAVKNNPYVIAPEIQKIKASCRTLSVA